MRKLKTREYKPVAFQANSNEQKAYLGVSVSSLSVMSEKLSGILAWMEKTYGGGRILIGDYLHRINEFILFGKSKEDAIDKSNLIGKLFHQQVENSLSDHNQDKFSIAHWEPIIKDSKRFSALLQELVQYCAQDVLFKNEIEKASSKYIRTQLGRGYIYLNLEEAVQKSNEYLLEEMAVFALYAGEGYTIHIYPGETLPVLKQITQGKFPGLNTALSTITYVELIT